MLTVIHVVDVLVDMDVKSMLWLVGLCLSLLLLTTSDLFPNFLPMAHCHEESHDFVTWYIT